MPKLVILSLFMLTAFESCSRAVAKPIISKNKHLKVMVIDSGVDSTIPELRKYIPSRYLKTDAAVDEHGHGTHVFGIIAAKACSDVEIIPCKGYKLLAKNKFDASNTLECFKQAITQDIDIVNYSAGGSFPDAREFEAIRRLDQAHILLVAAAGNEGSELKVNNFYPAGYDLDNIIAVGNLVRPMEPSKNSNMDDKLVWEQGVNVDSNKPGGGRQLMSGTSQATAKQTARLVEFFCKFKRKID